MADLGAVGISSGGVFLNILQPVVFFKTTSYSVSFNIEIPKETSLCFPKMQVIDEVIESFTKSIKGITRKDSIPQSKLVRLYDRKTGILLREQFSKPDGSFEFNNLSTTHMFYVVILDDENSLYNAEISDHLFATVG